ncbi:hypothetical protein [Candidatus Amarobacter glycogenicus]|uniref:hypothetical protein n=1 Tax=Candidatus Amarobacter glycogenicus TaxID=3140699 RepID=UPI003136A8F4|nr:hypothetical protein [Dehalococcoidia bacterium]
MENTEPIATGYVAPIHGRGAMGFLLVGLLGLLVMLAGLLAPDMALFIAGVATGALAGAGFAQYWRMASKWPLLHVYPNRLEFVRGPQRGSVAFEDVVGVRALEWGKSLFPYQKAMRVLVLQTGVSEWQIGPEVAEHAAVQEAVGGALEAFVAEARR